jgi:hypothetical protein
MAHDLTAALPQVVDDGEAHVHLVPDGPYSLKNVINRCSTVLVIESRDVSKWVKRHE